MRRQISTYQNRDADTHRALGVAMLFMATLGSQTFDHPELQSFREGFLLPCRNGFNLANVRVLPFTSR
jgi:hypothetical protein